MKLVSPSDLDLIAIEHRVNVQISTNERLMVATPELARMLYAAADAICPGRHLTFIVRSNPHTRFTDVECYENVVRMSSENPYQSEASMNLYAIMLQGLIEKKLEEYIGRQEFQRDPNCPKKIYSRGY